MTVSKNHNYKYIFEMQAMNRLVHPNIVEMFAYIIELGKRIILVEPLFASLHDLNKMVCNESQIIPESIFGHITVLIINTLCELRARNIIHGIMCPRDIVFSKDGTVKLLGFMHINIENATACLESNYYFLVSLIDINLGKFYDYKFDIWFFGLTLAQIVTQPIYSSNIEVCFLI